jgi:hypothetical protein
VRPPPLEVFAYRAFGWRLDGRYAGWIVEDVRSGRAIRWRWVTCGVVIAGTQLLVRAGFARRTPSSGAGPVLAAFVGVLLGLALGTLLVRRLGTERYVARVLRAQGLLEDGRRDPSPSWTGRLDNYGIASMQLAALAFVGLMAGYLPMRAIPQRDGRCGAPDAANLEALRAELRPGVTVAGLRAVRHQGVTFVAGAVEGHGIVTWQRFGGARKELLFGAEPDTAALTPAIGGGAPFGVGQDPWEALRAKAEGCAREAGRRGDGPTMAVAPPVPAVDAGVVRIRGALVLDARDVVARCPDGTGTSSASIPAIDGGPPLALLVRGPKVTVAVAGPTPRGRIYEGRLGLAFADGLLVEGALPPAPGSPGGPGARLEVSARLPCR